MQRNQDAVLSGDDFFGALWATQAVLPVMRAQRSGRILQVTGEAGVRAYPGIGAYHASKWALVGLSESLWQEVEEFGDPATREAILQLVDVDRPPRRLLLGRCYDDIARIYAERLQTWQQWQPVALSAF